MTVIKFTDDNKPNYILKPGINSTVSHVFDSVVKYATKENLPKSANRDALIFTTDTHEFFRGNGNGLDLIPFNSILLFDSFDKFPLIGIDTKIYVDKQSSIMFYWNGTEYQTIAGGTGGEIIISPNDKRVGDLEVLETADKTTIVAAINEVFNSLAIIDVDSILNNINIIESDINEIKSSLTNIDLTTVSELQTKVGSLDTLTTAEKTSIVGAINELKTLISVIGGGSGEVDLSEIIATIGTLSTLSTTNKADLVSAINEIFTASDNNSTSISSLLNSINNLEEKGTAVDGQIKVIDHDVTILQSTMTELNASIDQINTIIGSMSSLATQDKTTIVAAINEAIVQISSLKDSSSTLKEEISSLTDLVQSLLNGVVPNLQDRLSTLEQKVEILEKSHETPGTGEPYPPEKREILWTFDFRLPVGVATYELADDSKWGSSGNAIDLMEDLVGKSQNVFLYSLGSDASPTEPILVPFVGTEGTAPTNHGVWESYTGEEVVLEVASMVAWNFRLVKYA
ncbi:hypothetical protein [Lysinibacillus pakistanensis]|uniref:hypothetical protein n=1 Tax=Lysinibacillus pakistanensis TaxID=759811 RepID=UPI003D28B147